MIDFRFGMVIGMDYYDVKLMMVGPALGAARVSPGFRGNWWAIVLADSDTEAGWEIGSQITVAPDNAGLTVLDESLTLPAINTPRRVRERDSRR